MSSNKWKFSLEPGYFQDLATLAAASPTKITTQPALALIDREYPTPEGAAVSKDEKPWVRFTAHVHELNRTAPANVHYKILYLTRHGFGYHNQKHAEMGDEAWDNYWSLLDGDDKTTWFDAFLTPEGIEQAKDLNSKWNTFIDVDGAPLPQSLYSSPMARCLQTSTYVFKPLMTAHNLPFHPTIKEKLRERWTMHTCDKRRTKSWIQENWPDFPIEDGFEEVDQLGQQKAEETDAEHNARKHLALEDLFEHDNNEVISWTIHSYAMRAVIEACGAEAFNVREATSIAVLVKGEKL